MSGLFPQRQPIDVYPGTSRPIGSAHPVMDPRPAIGGWDQEPVFKRVDGYLREFFSISALALAINRSTKTIYKWESGGLFPAATFVFNSASKQGRRRLYTRKQIDGVVVIAAEQGVLNGQKRYITQTKFPLLCFELFHATRRALPEPLPEWNDQ